MSVFAQKREELARRIETIRLKLGPKIEAEDNARLQDRWPNWSLNFDEILGETKDQPEVVIALVGGVGAGKSTLINALVGVDLLPVSNDRACTSAITKVSYGPGPGFEVSVDFISHEDVRQEVETLRGDISGASSFVPDEGDPMNERVAARDLLQAARDKLSVIYQVDDPAELARGDLEGLPMPDEVAAALDAGSHSFRAEDLDDLVDRLGEYLSSEGRLWPIVKSASIRGPFETLEGGATLVDLPGLNDPNEAREQVTREYIKSSNFVWVVFGIGRGLTRDLYKFLESSDLCRQLFMEGRVDSMSFVATASDNIGRTAGIRQYKLPRDTTQLGVIQARNEAVRPLVAKQLEDLAYSIAEAAGEDGKRARDLADRLTTSPIFTVSSREFLRLSGLADDQPAGMDDVEQTEIPKLRDHLSKICARYDLNARFEHLHDQVELVLAEIGREAGGQIIQLDGQIEATQQQRDEVEAALKQAGVFRLKPELEKLEAQFSQELVANGKVLGARLKHAVERGEAELDQYMKGLERMHWASIKAMVNRDGRYVGTAGQFDCSVGIAKPILNSITFAWVEFFGEQLAHGLDHWTDKLVRAADDHRRALLDTLAPIATPDSAMREDLKRFAESAGKVLGQQLADTKGKVDRKIQDVQKNLSGSIVSQVRKNMIPAYRLAKQVSGTGSKVRMLEILAEHAQRVSSEMFHDVEKSISDGVRSLNNWLSGQYGDMTGTVLRHAELAGENLRLDAVATAPLEELEQCRDSLRALANLVETLGRRSTALAASA